MKLRRTIVIVIILATVVGGYLFLPRSLPTGAPSVSLPSPPTITLPNPNDIAQETEHALNTAEDSLEKKFWNTIIPERGKEAICS